MEQNRESNAELYRRRIQRLERLAWWMDEAFEIPFLKWRIGLDALFGFLPGFGDLVGAVIAMFVVLEAARLKVSGWVLARMGLNVLLEFLIGAIPVIGDVLDIHFKANRKNVTLLKAAGASVMTEGGRGDSLSGARETGPGKGPASADSMARHAVASKWVVVSVFAVLISALVGMSVMVAWLLGFVFKWSEIFGRQVYQYFLA